MLASLASSAFETSGCATAPAAPATPVAFIAHVGGVVARSSDDDGDDGSWERDPANPDVTCVDGDAWGPVAGKLYIVRYCTNRDTGESWTTVEIVEVPDGMGPDINGGDALKHISSSHLFPTPAPLFSLRLLTITNVV